MSVAGQERLLVVTDLDGTLLDEEYKWKAASGSMSELRRLGFPLVLNSSKTVAELTQIAASMGTEAPVIAENGGALAVPLQSPLADQNKESASFSGYQISVSGVSRDEIVGLAHVWRHKHDARFSGFADWSPEEIARRTGLESNDAFRAGQRWATEPIVWSDTPERWEQFMAHMARHGIRALRGGRFIHLMGGADKADGLRRVRELYVRAYPEAVWRTVALGDSDNDLAMLSAADIAVVVPRPGQPRLRPEAPRVVEAPVPGPRGWQAAMAGILSDYSWKRSYG